ncbi:MAG: hypothetical protein RIB86_06490 [Imperialibacter sp.]
MIKFRNILVDREARVDLIRKLIVFTVFFPFVPAVLRSTDTQPTFMLLAGFGMFYGILHPKQKIFPFSNLEIFGILALGALIFFSIRFNALIANDKYYIARVIVFFQFILALIVGLRMDFGLKHKHFRNILIAYVVFTGIYLLTNGLVENIFIGSRGGNVEASLKLGGRGARTLSPEPSFFALQMLNIIVIYFLFFGKKGSTEKDLRIVLLCLACLIASLSGYGMVIIVALVFVRFTKLWFTGLIALAASVPFLIEYLESYVSLRAVRLLITVFAENPMVIIEQDASVASRIGSFLAYIDSISKNFAFGDGFSLLQGGGLISLVASLGLVASFFMLAMIFEIFALKGFGLRKKLFVFFWFMLNFISGPIGIPAIGVTLGLILRNNHPSLFTPAMKQEAREVPA